MPARHIPIHALDPVHPVANALPAILSEVAALLDRLLSGGHAGAIDLLSLPLAPDVSADLETRLGQGEVYAEIELHGLSRIYETQYAGVWRVTHFGDDTRVIADTIEVDWAPSVLVAHRDDVRAARDRLYRALRSDTTE